MPLGSERTTINGVGYEVTKLPYGLGHKLLLRIWKTLGPTIAKAMAAAPTSELAETQVADLAPAFAAAVEGFSTSLSEADFDFMVETLAKYSKISFEDDKWLQLKDQMEFHYSGNYSELFQWLGFALKVNYLGFTGEQGSLADLLEKVKVAVQGLKSQSTSTGVSTGSQVPSDTPAQS